MAGTDRRKSSSSLLIMDVQLDITQGESIIKNELEKLGCTNGLQDVKWNVNKYTKQSENNCIIRYQSENFATKALEQLQNRAYPGTGTEPPITFNLIKYPPISNEENLLFARKCCFGLIISGYLQNVTTDCIRKTVLKYYASLKYIEVLETYDAFGRAAIWFMDIRDRDLAVKQLPLHKLCFCKPEPCKCEPERLNYQLIPRGDTSYIIPPHVDPEHQWNDSECERKIEVQRLYKRNVDVTPSHCKTNCGPGYDVLKANSTAFKSHKLPEVKHELELFSCPIQNLGNPPVYERSPSESLGRKPEWSWDSDQDKKDEQPMKGRGRARGRRFNLD